MEFRNSLPIIIFITLASILFFPTDKAGYLTIPIGIAIILGVIYWITK